MKAKHALNSCSIFLFILSVFADVNCTGQSIMLTDNGSSSYKIVVSSLSQSSYLTAQKLSSFIKQISGAALPVANDDVHPQEKEIIIGNNKHINALHLNIDLSKINNDEYVIKTFGNTILLYGKNDSDATSCVYWFLQKYLGCNMLSSDVTVIPHIAAITLPAINDDYSPSFTYRDLYYKDAYDSMYTKFNRIDHFNAGGQNRKWGEIWSSSFNYVIPPKKYFATHPEWFALNDKGQRIPDQLDVTNEEMFKEYVKNMRTLMQRFPNSKIWSVAANDAAVPNYCKCSNCEAINKREGTPMGALLTFVNKVAAKFPDKIIATQAYMFYEEPPKTIKPASNVMIVECGSYLLNHAVPYETSKASDAITYRRRLNGWLAITRNVRVWDYVTNYISLLCPFPNIDVQQKNLQYFARLGIKDMFMQGNIGKGGQLAELRAYILSRLLWNPNVNINDIMNVFLNNYYGKAAPNIKSYLSLSTSSLLKSGIPLSVHDSVSNHFNGFLSPNMLIQYNHIFDNAEQAVQNNPVQLEHVKAARLPVTYATLEAVKASVTKNKNVMNVLRAATNKKMQDVLTEFIQECKKNGIANVSSSVTVDNYEASLMNYIK
ncbi:MAG TPA: DUF4838 domain-containing protein [Parafilimonas sp.]|nr:DUF4838 domain-containing protein [Parafilimonas sp.]